ncbi:unnamed protein product [Lactuca virosa]|uniref:Uncharacterized protein n=1 Tax=Lactuca virosa TaxID=75947 RepID=A0AAU9PLD5_9ASTR|nr:unnamed protein product [Lactuca virosa]
MPEAPPFICTPTKPFFSAPSSLCSPSPSPIENEEQICCFPPSSSIVNPSSTSTSVPNPRYDVCSAEILPEVFVSNLLRRSKFSSVYKGVLRDRSVVEVCDCEELERGFTGDGDGRRQGSSERLSTGGGLRMNGCPYVLLYLSHFAVFVDQGTVPGLVTSPDFDEDLEDSYALYSLHHRRLKGLIGVSATSDGLRFIACFRLQRHWLRHSVRHQYCSHLTPPTGAPIHRPHLLIFDCGCSAGDSLVSLKLLILCHISTLKPKMISIEKSKVGGSHKKLKLLLQSLLLCYQSLIQQKIVHMQVGDDYLKDLLANKVVHRFLMKSFT